MYFFKCIFAIKVNNTEMNDIAMNKAQNFSDETLHSLYISNKSTQSNALFWDLAHRMGASCLSNGRRLTLKIRVTPQNQRTTKYTTMTLTHQRYNARKLLRRNKRVFPKSRRIISSSELLSSHRCGNHKMQLATENFHSFPIFKKTFIDQQYL